VIDLALADAKAKADTTPEVVETRDEAAS